MNIANFKYIVVGAGFFGATIAERIANDLGEPVLIIEKRNHIGGNCYSENDQQTGIDYHRYGPHIFHTSNERVWNYINRFAGFTNYNHQVLSNHSGRIFQMPINLETINTFYNINLHPFEVEDFLKKEIGVAIPDPKNFEEKAISLVGRPLYEAFIYGYTKKQWGLDPVSLPAQILNRLPFRNNYSENYYMDKWQGQPINGYTKIFDQMLNGKKINLLLGLDFFDVIGQIRPQSIVIYTGPIDRLFNYKHGRLEWRKSIFEKTVFNVNDWQGNAVVNYPDIEIPYTRIIEPKHFHPERQELFAQNNTLVFKEFSQFDDGTDPYYPINNASNQTMMNKYLQEVCTSFNVIIGGRLGEYKYYDMDKTIAAALDLYDQKINRKS